MILEEIEVENFLSHEHSKVCFTDSHLWLINGENGAGKSALFDALQYTLYGEHRGRGQNDAFLVKQGSQRAKITVVFSHHGVRYRVIYEIDYRSGNKGGRLAIWSATAKQWVPENIGDGVRAVWNWLKTKIPSYDLFCSAIFLRQNETAHFLAGTAGDRHKRFAALINLDRYTDLARKAQELARKAEVAREVTRQRSKDLGDLSDEALQQLETLWQDATNALDNAETAYKQAQQTASAAEAWTHLQTRRQQQERLAQDIRELLREEDRIQTAAQRVAVWGQVASRLEQYWRWRGEASVHHANAAAKRVEAEEARQKRQNTGNSLAVLQQRCKVIEQDELPMARQQAEATRTRLLRLEHERKIARACEQEISAQQDVEELAGADEAYVNWQNRSRALPRLQTLADARERLKAAENAVPQAEETFNKASQKSEEAHEQSDAIGRELEEAGQLRAQAEEWRRQLQASIARLAGQIESHGRLTGQEPECPVCAQVLNESTFRHVQEKLHNERADLEHKRTELDTQAQPALQRIDDRIMQLKRAQIAQQKKAKGADELTGQTHDKLLQARQQLKMECTNFTRTEESLLAEIPALAEHITEIDHVWVTREQATIATALPEAQTAAQRLKKVQNAYNEAHTRVVALREQRDLDAEPLGDRQTSIKIAILVREVTTKAKACRERVGALEQERSTLTQQATAQAETSARLAERAFQAQQLAEQRDKEAQVATREADQLYAQLHSEWAMLLNDRIAYDTEKQLVETLRPDAGRVAELAQARGRLQSVKEELQRITVQEAQISLDHRLPVEQAKQAETEAGQYQAAMRQHQHDAASAINTFHQKRQDNEAYRQEMERADRDVTTFSQLADLLKSGGTIQKAIAEQEQRRIAIEANNILLLLNDPLRIHIDQARRGRDTQDVTIIDTSDMASGDASSPNRSHRYFEFLSGGEQFRIALALALALHRLVGGDTAGTLIADEGFGALDSTRRDQLASQMADTSRGILSHNLVHSLIICSHATEVQHHFRDSCWIVEKRAGTASVRRAADEHF